MPLLFIALDRYGRRVGHGLLSPLPRLFRGFIARK